MLNRVSDADLIDQLRRLVDEQEGGDAVVLVQRQLFNRIVGRLSALSRRSPSLSGGEVVAWVTADILAAMKRGERVVPGWKRSDDFCIPLYTHPKEAEVTVTEEMVEIACKTTDPLLFSGDAQTEHMAASPYKVDHVKDLVRTKMRAALVAALSRKG